MNPRASLRSAGCRNPVGGQSLTPAHPEARRLSVWSGSRSGLSRNGTHSYVALQGLWGLGRWPRTRGGGRPGCRPVGPLRGSVESALAAGGSSCQVSGSACLPWDLEPPRLPGARQKQQSQGGAGLGPRTQSLLPSSCLRSPRASRPPAHTLTTQGLPGAGRPGGGAGQPREGRLGAGTWRDLERHQMRPLPVHQAGRQKRGRGSPLLQRGYLAKWPRRTQGKEPPATGSGRAREGASCPSEGVAVALQAGEDPGGM